MEALTIPKAQWTQVLTEINKRYRDDKQSAEDYASRVASGIAEVNLIQPTETNPDMDAKLVESAVVKWQSQWDMEWGGNTESKNLLSRGT